MGWRELVHEVQKGEGKGKRARPPRNLYVTRNEFSSRSSVECIDRVSRTDATRTTNTIGLDAHAVPTSPQGSMLQAMRRWYSPIPTHHPPLSLSLSLSFSHPSIRVPALRLRYVCAHHHRRTIEYNGHRCTRARLRENCSAMPTASAFPPSHHRPRYYSLVYIYISIYTYTTEGSSRNESTLEIEICIRLHPRLDPQGMDRARGIRIKLRVPILSFLHPSLLILVLFTTMVCFE